MRPRWKKVFADLWSHRIRSLLIILSIAIGLFAVGMISTLRVVLAADMRTSYSAVNPANVLVRSSAFDQDLVDRVKHLPGVADAYGAASLNLRLKTGQDEYRQFSVLALPDIRNININKVQPVEGVWPPKDDEIFLEVNKLSEIKIKLGDTLEIKLPGGELRKLRLVGTVHDLTIGQASNGGGYFMAPVQGYVTYNTLETLGFPLSLNTLYVTVSEQPNDLVHIGQIRESIVKVFEQNDLIIDNSVTRRSIDHPIIMYLDAISGVLLILGLLVVFLSGFLITNTLAALLSQQIQQVGVMKTIGGSRAQIIGIYMVLILIFSVLALGISIPLSNMAAMAELDFLAVRVNFIAQGHRSVPSAVLLQVIIALVVPQLAGAVPIFQGTRISIQEAVSGLGKETNMNEGWLYRLLARVRGLSRPMLISLRNTFRGKVRLALTLTTLVLSGAIFIATFNVRTYLDDYINMLRKYFIADANVTFSTPYRIGEINRILMDVPGVAAVEGWATAKSEIINPSGQLGDDVTLMGPPPDSTLIQPILLKGRWLKVGDQNAITVNELFADKFPGLKLGDTIPLKVNGQKTQWVVVGFFQFAGKTEGLIAYTTYDYLARLTHNPGRSLIYRVVGDDAHHSLAGQEELGRRIEAHLNDLGYRPTDIRAGLSLQESISKGLDTLTTFLMIMALLMAAVGSIGLTGTMSLNVMERTREIGVMRAIGATDRVIMNLVIVEGVIIGLMSWLISCVVAVPISKILSDVISQAIFNTVSTLTYGAFGVLIWLGVVVVLSTLASVLPARSAAHLTIREVLAYE